MNAVTARALLEDQLQWNVKPVLTVAEVDRLLEHARIVDTNSIVVDGIGYIPTWSMDSIRTATRQGLTMKMAKAAAQFDVAAGEGTSFKRSQTYQMLDQLLRLYGSSGSGIGAIQLRSS